MTSYATGASVTEWFLCGDRHEYVVGSNAAVCNRCSKVVHFHPQPGVRIDKITVSGPSEDTCSKLARALRTAAFLEHDPRKRERGGD